MPTDVERLVVRLEATQAKFEKQLAAANRTASRRANQIERRFASMNRTIGNGISRAARGWAAALAAGFTVNTVKRLSDAATRIDNALKIAGLRLAVRQ